MKDDDRVKVLTEYLKATPTKEETAKQLGLSGDQLDKVWERIQQSGWDGALKYYEQQRATLKGQWLEVAGEQYGSKKAESWLPEDYEYGLESASEDMLSATVTDARDALEAAIAADAVDDSKRTDLEELAAKLPGRKIDALAAESATIDPAIAHQLEECNKFIAEISAKRDVINKELLALPSAAQSEGMPCPHCNTILQVDGKSLVIAAVLSEDELTTRQAAIDTITSKLAGVNDAIAKHMDSAANIKRLIAAEEQSLAEKRGACKQLVEESEKAVTELSKTAVAGPTVSVDDCRSELAGAEKKLAAYRAKIKADKIHLSVCAMESLITKIAPDGIRGDVLAKALKGFNEKLATISAAASWSPVVLETDFMPTYGGTIYLLLSESAKFRVRVVLQIAMAMMDRSQVLVIDAADILDKGGRNGLFKAVKTAGLPVMISMTFDGQELMPDLGKAGIGRSYWIEGGVVVGI